MAFDFNIKGLFFFLVVGMASTVVGALAAVGCTAWFIVRHVAIV
jgi:hypothetical protein